MFVRIGTDITFGWNINCKLCIGNRFFPAYFDDKFPFNTHLKSIYQFFFSCML